MCRSLQQQVLDYVLLLALSFLGLSFPNTLIRPIFQLISFLLIWNHTLLASFWRVPLLGDFIYEKEYPVRLCSVSVDGTKTDPVQSVPFCFICKYCYSIRNAPRPLLQKKLNYEFYQVFKQIYLTLTLYFEAVTTIMLGILGFPVSPDLYNSFGVLLICFHDLISGSKLFSKLDFAQNWNATDFLS